MKRKLKSELTKIYEAPMPIKKRAFLRAMNPQPMNTWYILWTQISYISGLEWIISAVLFGATVFLSCFFKSAVFHAVFAFMPFLAAVGVSESMRSVTYGMEELEMSARFSLKSIILARMGIIGIENLALALFAALFMQGGFLQTVLYLLVPYLATAYGSLFIMRNISNREGCYVCMGFSVAISLAAYFSSMRYSWFYQEQFQYFWMIAVLLLLCMNYRESRQLIKIMEYC